MEGATAAGADDAGPITQADRIRAALWGLFVSDALAMPTHWYYGGSWQIQEDFGGPITKFERSQRSFPGSIMNKSNTGGGGRGSDRGSIIGDVINHGKKKYWTSGKGFHYHHTLERGENTLEAQLVRVLMKSIVACGGAFRREHFCDAYVQFMTTPGSHNDTYASTAHRQFFENFVKGVDPMQCASNDGHNTDAIDALVLPAVVGLATLNQPLEAAVAAAQECGEVTRRSQPVQAYIAMVVGMLRAVAEGAQGGLQEVTRGVATAQFPRLDLDAERDLVTAWWFHLNYKYAGRLREGVLVNANAGGENVHRGELLGLALGLQEGRSSAVADFVAALRDHKKLAVEIEAFVQCVSGSGGGSGGGGGGSEGGAGGDGGDAGRGEGGDGDGDDDEAALPATL